MSSSKQRLASATATRLAAITDMAANLEAQLSELNRLRDQLRKAELSARGFTNDRRMLEAAPGRARRVMGGGSDEEPRQETGSR
jgi:hypothetical protein